MFNPDWFAWKYTQIILCYWLHISQPKGMSRIWLSHANVPPGIRAVHYSMVLNKSSYELSQLNLLEAISLVMGPFSGSNKFSVPQNLSNNWPSSWFVVGWEGFTFGLVPSYYGLAWRFLTEGMLTTGVGFQVWPKSVNQKQCLSDLNKMKWQTTSLGNHHLKKSILLKLGV